MITERTIITVTLLVLLAVIWTSIITQYNLGNEYNCFSKADGSNYCYAKDGHLFRPRFNKFIIKVKK